MACGGSCGLLKSAWDTMWRRVSYWNFTGISNSFLSVIYMETYLFPFLFHFTSPRNSFINSSNNRTWLRFSCLSTPAYVLSSPHCLPVCEKPSMPEVFQGTLQHSEKAASNHCLPRHPDFSVKPQEARWLRPGQWLERRAAPLSRSKLKKTSSAR